MSYKIKYRRRLIPKTLLVDGHRYETASDKMVLYFPDGSIREIPEWSKCQVDLGLDWVATVKKNMEQQSGQSIPVK